LKYFATPMVRSSVAKKFAALMSFNEDKFSQFFEIHDLEADTWNQCGGLAVKPIYSPHPVETTLLLFRALDGDGYRTYAHWTDLTSFAVLEKMMAPGPFSVDPEFVNQIKENYLLPVDLKKLDIGGGMIHGMAQDFREDSSKRLLLAHLSRELTTEEMEIGSESAFGALDILIPGEQDYRRQRAFYYLRELLPEISDDDIRMLINGLIVKQNAGSFLRRESDPNGFVEMTVSGDVVYLDADFGIRYHLGFGAFMGLQQVFPNTLADEGSYRALSHSEVLRIPVPLFKTFLENTGLFSILEKVLEKIRFLRHTWLFGEQTSFVFLARIAQTMESIGVEKGAFVDVELAQPLLWVVVKGQIAILAESGRCLETIHPGGFFGEQSYLQDRVDPWRFQAIEACELAQIHWSGLLEAPIIHWKMLEIDQKRSRLSAVS
ncbi:MAG: cyclic nucleotide-binding domain-containing protein, partial [Magnetococcales bacterium]|nr:cyclic nucleotide-binding domain-containing protein [Magnetococcales bacterium]